MAWRNLPVEDVRVRTQQEQAAITSACLFPSNTTDELLCVIVKGHLVSIMNLIFRRSQFTYLTLCVAGKEEKNKIKKKRIPPSPKHKPKKKTPKPPQKKIKTQKELQRWLQLS